LRYSNPTPGQVIFGELQNVIERSVILCEERISQSTRVGFRGQPVATELRGEVELSQRLALTRRKQLRLLERKRRRVFGPSGAAVKLGMPRSTLESKIRSLKIDKNRFKIAEPSKNN